MTSIINTVLSAKRELINNQLSLSINYGSEKKVDPNQDYSFIKALVDGLLVGFQENDYTWQKLIDESFIQTSTDDEYLNRQGVQFQVSKQLPQQASGVAIFTGTVNTAIPADTSIQKADGTLFTTQNDTTIISQVITASNLTRTSNVAFFTTAQPHNLATGMILTISGAHNSNYNITTIITVNDPYTFFYLVNGSPPSPDAHVGVSPILATSSFGLVNIIADEAGANGNTASGTQLQLVSPIANVDDVVYLTFDATKYGADEDTQEEFRQKILKRANGLNLDPFSIAGIENYLKDNVFGISRVWVQSATPSAGSITVYFDTTANNISTSNENVVVKNALMAIRPPQMSSANIIVNSPTAVPINITFSSLSPITQNMKTAITTELQTYFKSDQVAVGKTVSLREINSVLYNVVDSDGNSPTFTISAPAGDTAITNSQLAILGTITF